MPDPKLDAIRSGVIAFAPAGFSLPALAAFTQLRKVCSTKPSSSATRPILPTSATRLTACSLNSAVYSCFGILIIFASKVTSIVRYPWKTKFEGKLTSHQMAGLGHERDRPRSPAAAHAHPLGHLF